jgi:iron complex transport system substrate-binding protein
MNALLAAAALLAAGPGPHWLGDEPQPPPKRIVSLAPSLTELLFEVGEGARVVGVTRYDDLPAAAKLPRVGGFSDPNPEAILALNPDAIFCTPSPGNRGPVEAVVRLGVPALVFPLDTVEDVLEAVDRIGLLLADSRQRGHELRSRITAARNDARLAWAEDTAARVDKFVKQTEAGQVEKGRRTRLTAVLLVGTEPLVAAGPKSYAGELLADARAENVATGDVPFPILSAERLLAAAPDVVLLAPGSGALRLPGLKARVVTLPSDAVLRPGPRIVQALSEITAALWGTPPK